MANDKDIKIGIGTEGNTSGAEKVEDALKNVDAAAQEVNQTTTTGTTQANEAERESQRVKRDTTATAAETAAELERVSQAYREETEALVENTIETFDQARATEDAARAETTAAAASENHARQTDQTTAALQKLVAVAAADAGRKIGESFKGISPEIDQAIGGVDTFLTTFAATGNPIAATAALIVGEIGNIITATRDLDNFTKETSQRQVDMLEGIRKGREILAQQIRSENLSAFFDKETQAIDRQFKALERTQRLAAAQREADLAIQKADQGTAAANVRPGEAGPSALANAADNKFVELGNGLQALTAQVALAQKALSDEEQKLTNLQLLAGSATLAEGAGSDTALKAEADAEAAKIKFAELQEDTALIIQEALLKQQALLANSRQSFAELDQQAATEATDLAQKVKSEIQAISEKSGAEVSPIITQAFSDITRVVTDNVPDDQQLQQISNIAAQAKNARDAADNKILSLLQTQATQSQAFLKKLNDLQTQVNERIATQ